MIAVVTDSTCDLHPDNARQLGIQIVPLHITMEGRTLLDWVEIDPDAVYDHMRAGGAATTTPVPAATFADVYRDLLKTHDSVLSLHLSGHLSETFKHAQQAAASLGEGGRVLVVDSKVAGAPLADMAMAASAKAQEGADLKTAAAAAQAAGESLYAEMSVASLEYLRRGGRISRAQAFFGNMLGVRPILEFDDGRLKAARRAKVDQAAGDMLASLKARFGDTPVSATVMHAGRDTARINALRSAMMASGLNVQKGRVQLMGPVIGAHVGPGTFGFSAVPLT
ncbi:DegV family EDD domain-containing protein [Deinococcus sp. HMF7620]|uniref:DegV family EDD domain-containing protein n=1 Tax=Deinococcus arboris TaxID=2682977 RepID=A0A7C9LN41_9DEIO|nr:DegV family protein [Deinococcus arboris]MVN88678.1 DegV family EDD domain-containing protein [Deinococcus arboris]